MITDPFRFVGAFVIAFLFWELVFLTVHLVIKIYKEERDKNR